MAHRKLLDLLILEDQRVFEYVQLTDSIWREILEQFDDELTNLNSYSLANQEKFEGMVDLGLIQFERHCGDKIIGRELMGSIGIARVLSPVLRSQDAYHSERAEKLYFLIRASRLPIEFRDAAKNTLIYYGHEQIIKSVTETLRLLREPKTARL